MNKKEDSSEDFLKRLEYELDKIEISDNKKNLILELMQIEQKYPTTDKDAINRYQSLLEEYMGEDEND